MIQNNNWEWSSHQPVIRTVMTYFKPKFILELGCGDFSTPTFHEFDFDLMVSVENNIEWGNKVAEKYEKDNFIVFHHDLGEGIKNGTLLSELTEEQKNKIEKDYKEMRYGLSIKGDPTVLFVDHYACVRTLAINIMCKYFDIIIYHDCQPEGVKLYEYEFGKDLNFYRHFEYRTPISWTGIFIDKNFDFNLNKVKDLLRIYTKEYCLLNGLDEDKFYLEECL